MSEIQHHILTTPSLLKSLAAALVLAIVLFVTTVLPAEFGIDPTGIGAALGLTELAATDAAPEPILRPGSGDIAFRQDENEIVVPAKSGLEFKFFLEEHATLNFSWTSTAPLYFDMHGEPEGDTSGYFESYGAATADSFKGTVTLPFAGSHGWYWQNEHSSDVVVSLQTMGNYEVLGLR
ncbi:MAG: hypothetical protein MI746_12520 [Pseudomonadales bacterium]|nr:hypothetical protein [Pseudomonadales bacterium]